MKRTWSQRTLAIAIMLLCTLTTFSQSKIPALDQSGMDMSYYPPNYPILKIQDKVTEPLVVRVVYSRPQKNGRTVFGQLVEFDKVWRMGANEATEIEFYRDVLFLGKPVPKGRYTLYSIPGLTKWTVILNKETDTWGSFIYDEKKDLLRVEVLAEKTPEPVEYFSLFFEKAVQGFNMIAAWDDLMISVPISVYVKPSRIASKTPVKTPVKKAG
ncbi:MAG: DUF2911 domain-containing protein [Chitinophagaceae bacterium]